MDAAKGGYMSKNKLCCIKILFIYLVYRYIVHPFTHPGDMTKIGFLKLIRREQLKVAARECLLKAHEWI